MDLEHSCDRVLEAYESGDLILQAILDGRFEETNDSQLDTLYAELELMDSIAIKVAGGVDMVHWEPCKEYQ